MSRVVPEISMSWGQVARVGALRIFLARSEALPGHWFFGGPIALPRCLIFWPSDTAIEINQRQPKEQPAYAGAASPQKSSGSRAKPGQRAGIRSGIQRNVPVAVEEPHDKATTGGPQGPSKGKTRLFDRDAVRPREKIGFRASAPDLVPRGNREARPRGAIQPVYVGLQVVAAPVAARPCVLGLPRLGDVLPSQLPSDACQSVSCFA